MSKLNHMVIRGWQQLGPRFLPFADAASTELPLGRLLRLSLFQISVGMAMVLLTGTLNRVMIIELHVPAWLVALMVSLPIVFAPFRALIGFKSDTHKSVLGWRRVPYIWFGSMMQFGGFAIMPFALLILSGDTHGPMIIGEAGAAFAFLLVGAGLHTTQTAGIALANDLASDEKRPRVVALLYVMLLIGMTVSALVFGALLRNFSEIRLIQIIQGAAVLTMVLNGIAMWQQEARNPALTNSSAPKTRFADAWKQFINSGSSRRLLVAAGIGTAGFSMQDILLEPFGGEVFGLGVSQTTLLTAMTAVGTLIGFGLAAKLLARGTNTYRVASLGLLAGIAAFIAIIFAPVTGSVSLFRAGTFAIGFGGGLFSVGILTGAMNLSQSGLSGLALGAWGAVQASAAGLAIAFSGSLRDLVSKLAEQGALGATLSGHLVGYTVVYQFEVLMLFATLAVVGPLVSRGGHNPNKSMTRFGLAELPG